MMKALVTGGHGFIGSFLVEKLIQEGFSVRCLVRKNSNLRWIKQLPVELIYGDITDKDSLIPAVKNVDYIYHIAGAIKSPTKEKFYSVNTNGTVYLAESSQNHNPSLKRFVFISSVSAHGPVLGEDKPTEDFPAHPISNYGHSKLKAEILLKETFPKLPLTIIRPPIVYGPRDENFLTFFKLAKIGFFPKLPTLDKNTKRYYSIVYVKDLVEGIYKASLSETTKGQTYFISNPEIYSFEEMAKKMSKPFSKNPRFIYIPKIGIQMLALAGDAYMYLTKKDIMLNSQKMPELMASSWICSPEKARRDFQFQTQTSLDLGMQETAEWFKREKSL